MDIINVIVFMMRIMIEYNTWLENDLEDSINKS